MQQAFIGQFALPIQGFDGLHILSRHETRFKRQVGKGRLTAQFLQQLMAYLDQAANRLDHVHGDADGTGILEYVAADGLTDPPGGIGAETKSARRVKFAYGAQQSKVAFLNQIHQGNAAVSVMFGHTHNQTQVVLHQCLSGFDGVSFHPN